jgi:hypothetical protein
VWCPSARTGSKQFVARNSANAGAGSAGGPWTDNTDYALEITPTDSTGTFKLSAYAIAGDGTETLVWNTTIPSGLSTSAFDRVELGKNTSTAAGGTWDYDYLRVVDTVNLYIGPDNVPPTLSLTPTQNALAGAAVSVTATAGDIDGSIVSYAWSVVTAKSSSSPSLTGASTATVSFTAPAAGNLVTLQCVVTDNGGLTKTVTTEVRVPLVGASVSIKPLTGIDGTSIGTWAKNGSAATDGEALSDGTDTKNVESPTLAGTEVSKRVRLQPCNALSAATTTARLQATGSGFTVTVRLYEGGALRQTWTQAVTTSAAAYTFPWDPATIAAITDWGNLYREVAASRLRLLRAAEPACSTATHWRGLTVRFDDGPGPVRSVSTPSLSLPHQTSCESRNQNSTAVTGALWWSPSSSGVSALALDRASTSMGPHASGLLNAVRSPATSYTGPSLRLMMVTSQRETLRLIV